jgi:hypothetical protein
MHLWYPDTCRAGQCVLEIVDGQALVLCAYHKTIRRSLVSDAALFDAIVATNRAKNYGTYEVAKELAGAKALDELGGANELHATVPWRIDDQDRVVVTAGLSGARKTRLQNTINTLLGTGRVIVE